RKARVASAERGRGPVTPPPPRPLLLIRQQTLGPPSPFVAIMTQFVLVHLQLGEQVFNCAQFGLGYGETGEQGTLQFMLRLRRAPAQATPGRDGGVSSQGGGR